MLGRGVVGDVSFAPPLSASGDGGCDRLTDRKVAAIFVFRVRGGRLTAEKYSKGDQEDSREDDTGA